MSLEEFDNVYSLRQRQSTVCILGLVFSVLFFCIGCGGAVASPVNMFGDCKKGSARDAIPLRERVGSKGAFEMGMHYLSVKRPEDKGKLGHWTRCRRIGLYLVGLSGQPGGSRILRHEVDQVARATPRLREFLVPSLTGLAFWLRWTRERESAEAVEVVSFLRDVTKAGWWLDRYPDQGIREPGVVLSFVERAFVALGRSQDKRLYGYLLELRDGPSNRAALGFSEAAANSLVTNGIRVWEGNANGELK